MATYKVGDKYFNEQYQLLGTEQDIQAGTFKPSSVTGVPTQLETTQGGILAPSIQYATGASGLSEDIVRNLYKSAGFTGFTEQTPEQLSQQIYSTDAAKRQQQAQQFKPLESSNISKELGYNVDRFTNWYQPGSPGGGTTQQALAERTKAIAEINQMQNLLAPKGYNFIGDPRIQEFIRKLGGLGATPTSGAQTAEQRAQQDQLGQQPATPTGTQPTTTQAGIQPTQPQTQFGPSSYTGPSIMDYLSSKGQNPSFSSRSQLAAQFLPGQTYTGTPEQNTELLRILKSQGQQVGADQGANLGVTQDQFGNYSKIVNGTEIRTDAQGNPLTGGPFGLPTGATPAGVGTQPQQEQQSQTYTVKSGDTLSQIAAQLGVNWKTDITGFKSGDPDLIFPGEVLTIKKAFTPTPSTDLPPPEPKDTGIGGADDTTPPPPEQTNPLTPGEEDYSKVLQQRSYDDYVDSFSKKLGLDDLKKQLGDLNLALEAAKQKGINRRNDINNNPWISEELRGRKIANADRASKEEEALALEQFNLVQKQYDNAREEIKFAAKMAVDQQNEDRDFYFKAKAAALKAQRDALKDAGIDTQVTSVGNRQLLINSQTGETIKDLGPTTFKPTAGTTGMAPQEIEDLDTQIYGLMGQLSPQQLDELISLGLL